MFAPQTLTDLDRQSLAAEHVDHRQGPELVAIAKLIMDEVEAPDFVGLFRFERLNRSCRWTTILRRRGRLPRKATPSSR
jgi:hypothetical protein